MKILKIIFTVCLFSFVCVSCQKEVVKEPVIIVGESDIFTEEEISEAINCVVDNFEFPASTLKKVWYDEEWAKKFEEDYIPTDTLEENIIILLSNIYVDDSGENPVLGPDTLYENYNWILSRDDKDSAWEIVNQGY